MANLLTEIPKHIQNWLDDAFTIRAVGGRQNKQKIDVGTRGKACPAIAANGGDCAGLACRGNRGRLNIGCHIASDLSDEFVFEMSKAAGAGKTAAIALKCLTNKRAALFNCS